MDCRREGGKAWFTVEAKSFEIAIEEKGKKLKGCIWERCKRVTSWIKFGDSSLWHVLLGLEDCENIARNQHIGSQNWRRLEEVTS